MCITCKHSGKLLSEFLMNLDTNLSEVMLGRGDIMEPVREAGVHHSTRQMQDLWNLSKQEREHYEKILRIGFNLGIRTAVEHIRNDYHSVALREPIGPNGITIDDHCSDPPVEYSAAPIHSAFK